MFLHSEKCVISRIIKKISIYFSLIILNTLIYYQLIFSADVGQIKSLPLNKALSTPPNTNNNNTKNNNNNNKNNTNKYINYV